MNISCDVILDLIPLVKDGVASDGSAKIVNEHIKSCDQCRTEFEGIEKVNVKQLQVKDEKIIFAIRRSIYITRIIILLVGGSVGIALTNSMGIVYNIIIMPIIGGLSYFVFKKKWYITAIAIFIITYLWQIVTDIVLSGFYLVSLTLSLYFSVLYTILIGLGVLIAMLLKFAFKAR